jgi:hypothetical protein
MITIEMTRPYVPEYYNIPKTSRSDRCNGEVEGVNICLDAVVNVLLL